MHKLAIILAVLLVPALARATPLENYHQEADGADYAPAFKRAQIACGLTPCDIDLRLPAYELHHTVEICTSVRLVGHGIGAAMQGSAFYTKGRITAFRTWAVGMCPWHELAAYYGRLAGEHLTIVNLEALPVGDLGVPGEAPHFGVDARTTLSLTDVGVSGFAQGVRLVCDVQAADHSNCSNSFLINVAVVLSEHAGVFMRGGDSNANTVIGGRSDTNCRNAARWNAEATGALCAKEPDHTVCSDPHFQCAGYMDLAFLGNTFVGNVTHAENGYAGYVFAGASQASSIIGAYAEGDTAPQFVDPRSNVIGGLNNFSGLGGQLHGSTMPGLTIGYGTWVALGTASHGTNAFMATGNAKTGPHSWRWKLDPTTGDLYIDVGNVNPRRSQLPFDVSGAYSVVTWGAIVLLVLLLVALVWWLNDRRKHKPPKPPKPPRKDDEAPPSGAEPITTPDDESPP